MVYRHNIRVCERRTLRGFAFPPCLLDMVVVDVEGLCDLAGIHETSHMLTAALETLFYHPLAGRLQAIGLQPPLCCAVKV